MGALVAQGRLLFARAVGVLLSRLPVEPVRIAPATVGPPTFAMNTQATPKSETPSKKQSLMPSGDLRRKLRAAGHNLRPLIQIGKEGTTAAVIKQLDHVLLDHELVKVKILAECPHDRGQVAALLAAQPDLHIAQVLGRTVLAYRKNPERAAFE